MLVGVEQPRPEAVGDMQQMVDEVTGMGTPSATRRLLLETVQVAAQSPLDLGGGLVRVQDLGDLTHDLHMTIKAVGHRRQPLQGPEGLA